MRFSTSTLGANYHFQPKSVVDPNHLGNVLTVVSDKKIAVGATTQLQTIYERIFDDNDLTGILPDPSEAEMPGTITIIGGKLKVNPLGGYGGINLTFATTQNTQYLIEFDFDAGNTTASDVFDVAAYNKVGSVYSNLNYYNPPPTTGHHSYLYTSTGATSFVKLYYKSGTNVPNHYFIIDNFKVSAIVPLVGPPTQVDHFVADIISSTDYYSFGATMNGRSFNTNSYKYGFNGKEKDPEGLGGGGATYDYGFRIYNPSLGKFLSVDPLSSDFPCWSPYAFAMNRPIDGIDVDGLEFLKKTDALIQFSNGYGGVALNISNFNESQKKTWDKQNSDMSNWGGGKTIGASPLLIDVDISEPPPNPKAGKEKTDYSSVNAQKNFLATPQEKAYLPKKIRDRWVANKLPEYKNEGAANATKVSNGVTILSNATKLFAYVQETYADINWAIAIVTAEKQSVFAQRTMEVVQDAINKGFIKPEQQTTENIYAIMNYVLSGDSYGNKIAEGIAKDIIKIYGVPVQPAEPRGTTPTEPIPPAAPTNQTTPTSSGTGEGGSSVKILD